MVHIACVTEEHIVYWESKQLHTLSAYEEICPFRKIPGNFDFFFYLVQETEQAVNFILTNHHSSDENFPMWVTKG